MGIAVSYGLLSRKQDEIEKENGAKFDNVNTYLSRFLQVSSVFDEEIESTNGSDESKVQTWSNRYYREEPVLVVAQNNSVLEEQRGVNSVFTEKPLLLPVRSLKSRVSESENIDKINKRYVKNGSFTRSNSNLSSNSGSNRFSSDSKKFENDDFEDFGDIKSELKSEENIVLRSPIPWRSRSGRMENRENTESIPLFSLSSETEDYVSNNFYQQKSKTPPPAPPPPPPPPRHHRMSPLGKPISIPAKAPSRREIEEFDEFERGEETEDDEIRGEKEEIETNDSGPDVDKKADEFIAKFREQIRLQRIQSIKRTTEQVGRSS